MPTFQFVSKSDAEILTDLQTLSSLVTGYITIVGVPQITVSSVPPVAERQKLKRYFTWTEFKKVVQV